MFTPFLQLRIHFKMWLLHRAIRSLELKVGKAADGGTTPNPSA